MTLELVPEPATAPVIRLDPNRQSEIKRDNFCFHRQYLLDEDKRTVSCGTCGAPLDAFQVLHDYARRERHWRYLDREAREAEARLKELKAEERRVKARTASASRKDSAAAVAAERAQSERERIAISEDTRDIVELCRRIERRLQRRRTL
ncbi:MAG TPA: hypothetical protein VFS67_30660 [Polyangiaceae bacterium]|nr:hypothetical protein [Polyangiaceae bacterium]